MGFMDAFYERKREKDDYYSQSGSQTSKPYFFDAYLDNIPKDAPESAWKDKQRRYFEQASEQQAITTTKTPTLSATDASKLEELARQMRMAGANESDIENNLYKTFTPKAETPKDYKSLYGDFTKNYDYEANKDYRSTKHGEGTRDALSGYMFDTGYDDIEHDIINKDPIARLNYDVNNGNNVLMDNSYLDLMSQEQVEEYNYLYNTKGKEEAQKYIKSIKKDLQAIQRANEAKFLQEQANEEGFVGGLKRAGLNALSVGANLLKPLEVISQAGELLSEGEINEYSRISSQFTNTTNAINTAIGARWDEAFKRGMKESYLNELRANGSSEDEVKYASENYNEKTGEGIGNFVYQTLASMENFLATSALTGNFSSGATKINKALSLAIMGAGATADTVVEQKMAGADDAQAFSLGVIAGLAEIATEKFSIESLLNTNLLSQSTTKYVLKNFLTEGAEEVGSDLINGFADILIMADKSQLKLRMAELEKEGKTSGEAFGIALAEYARDAGLSFLGGAISGGIMGAGSAYINNSRLNTQANVVAEEMNYANPEFQQGIVNSALEDEKGSDTRIHAEALKRMLDNGESLSNLDVHKQVLLNEQANLDDNIEEVKASLEAAKNNYNNKVSEKAETKKPYNVSSDLKLDSNLNIEEEIAKVSEFAQNFNKSAQTVIERMYGDNIPAVEYNEAMNKYYNAGYKGDALETINTNDRLTDAQRVAMYEVGAMTRENESNEPKLQVYEGEEWNDSKNIRIITNELEVSPGDVSKVRLYKNYKAKDSGSISLVRGEQTELGSLISGYKGNRLVTLVDTSKGETESMKKARKEAETRGKKVYFTFGLVNVVDEDGNESENRGLIQGDTIIVQVDHSEFTADQIIAHELGHDKIDSGEIDVDASLKNIYKTMGEEKFWNMVRAYAEAYDDGEGFDDAKFQKWVEEIICDALGKMNAFEGYSEEKAKAFQPVVDTVAKSIVYNTQKANAPPSNNEVKMSQEMASNGVVLSEEQSDFFADSKIRDAEGRLLVMYHGTARADRVGNVFRSDRATSGPMAFFTSDPQIAENYSKDKNDTSLDYDEDYDMYETQFKVKTDRFDRPLYKLWSEIPFSKKQDIKKKAGELREDWDSDDGSFVLVEGNTSANGGFEWQLKESNGNVIKALIEQWLFNEEERFLEVLEKTGITQAIKDKYGVEPYYKDKNFRDEKVYSVFLNIANPFVAYEQVNEKFVSGFEEWANEHYNEYEEKVAYSDMWDKNNVSAEDFADRMRNDIENNTTHAWTSIPDIATDYLKTLGYDGIVDNGGKFHNAEHQVVIPFYSNQIKDINNLNPTENVDIHHSLELIHPIDITSKQSNVPKQFAYAKMEAYDHVSSKEFDEFDADYRRIYKKTNGDIARHDYIVSENHVARIYNAYSAVDYRISEVERIDDVIKNIMEGKNYAETSNNGQETFRIPSRIFDAIWSRQEFSDWYATNIKDGQPEKDAFGYFVKLRERKLDSNKGRLIGDDTGNSKDVSNTSRKINKSQEITNADLKALQKENRELEKRLEKTAEQVARWKSELKVDHTLRVQKSDINRITDKLLQEYSAGTDKKALKQKLTDLANYVLNNNSDENYVDTVKNMAIDIASDIINDAKVLDEGGYSDVYNDLKMMLTTGNGMKLSSRDIADIPDFKDFKKQAFGKLKITESGRDVDSTYEELMEMYPELFSEDVTHPADRLMEMVDVVNKIAPRMENPFDMYLIDMAEITETLANEIVDMAINGEMKATLPNFATRQENKLNEQKAKTEKTKEQVKEMRDKKNAEIEEVKSLARQRMEKLRQKRNEDIKNLKEEFRTKKLLEQDKRDAKTYRGKIEKIVKDLNKRFNNPTDKHHIPKELRTGIAALLNAINMTSSRDMDADRVGLPTLRTEAFRQLQKGYEKIMEDGGYVVDEDLLGTDGWLEDIISWSDTPIMDMTSTQLEIIYKALRSVEHSIATADKMLSDKKGMKVSMYANGLINDNANAKPKTVWNGKIGAVINRMSLGMLTPQAYMERLGKYGDMLFKKMRKAQDKYIDILKEARDFTHDVLGKVDVNKLSTTLHEVRFGNKTVTMSTAQIMELYALSKREQAMKHILAEGIVPDAPKNNKLKVNRTVDAIRVTQEDLTRAFSLLTVEQIDMVDKMQKFLSEDMAKHGNEASMAVYGYEKFGEDNYWHIESYDLDVNGRVLAQQRHKASTVAGKGMAKALSKRVSVAIRIGDAFDSFSKHIVDMAEYSAWLATMEDLNRILNYKVKDENNLTKTSVKRIIDTIHGVGGVQYFEKLVEDLANGVASEQEYFGGLLGNFKASSVGTNLRVILQQPTAILRAMEMIDAKYLLPKVGVVSAFKGWQKAIKYSPIAQWKDWGYFDINTGRAIKDVLFDNTSKVAQARELAMKPAGMADSYAWGMLWNAVEAETKAEHKDLKVGSEEYYQHCAERFSDIIDHSQVVDGVLQRSQMMRSTNGMDKMATAFMGEPTKQYNQFLNAIYNYKRGHKDAGKRLTRTIFAMASAGVVNATVQSLVDAMRHSDRDKDYWEQWLEEMIGISGDEAKFEDYMKNIWKSNLFGVVDVASYIPYAKDIESIIQGYTVERMDMSAVSDAVQSANNFMKVLKGESKLTFTNAFTDFAFQAGKIFGVSAYNIKRDMLGVASTVINGTGNLEASYELQKMLYDVTSTKNRSLYISYLYEAYKTDKTLYGKILKDLQKIYSNEQIQTSMRNLQKKEAGVTKLADLKEAPYTLK